MGEDTPHHPATITHQGTAAVGCRSMTNPAPTCAARGTKAFTSSGGTYPARTLVQHGHGGGGVCGVRRKPGSGSGRHGGHTIHIPHGSKSAVVLNTHTRHHPHALDLLPPRPVCTAGAGDEHGAGGIHNTAVARLLRLRKMKRGQSNIHLPMDAGIASSLALPHASNDAASLPGRPAPTMSARDGKGAPVCCGAVNFRRWGNLYLPRFRRWKVGTGACCMRVPLLAAVVAAVSGGEDIWPQFGHDARHTSSSPFVGPHGPSVAVAWTFDAGALVDSSPAITADGTVRCHRLPAPTPLPAFR